MSMEFKNCTGTVRAEITTPDGITFSIEMPLVVSGKLEPVHGESLRVGGSWGYVQGSELEEVVLTLVGRKAPDGIYATVKTETAAPPPSVGEGGAPSEQTPDPLEQWCFWAWEAGELARSNWEFWRRTVHDLEAGET